MLLCTVVMYRNTQLDLNTRFCLVAVDIFKSAHRPHRVLQAEPQKVEIEAYYSPAGTYNSSSTNHESARILHLFLTPCQHTQAGPPQYFFPLSLHPSASQAHTPAKILYLQTHSRQAFFRQSNSAARIEEELWKDSVRRHKLELWKDNEPL